MFCVFYVLESDSVPPPKPHNLFFFFFLFVWTKNNLALVIRGFSPKLFPLSFLVCYCLMVCVWEFEGQ